jgi:murein DD-endopeptidase MepM/ murein hydrolase activator NlpD
MKHILTAKIIGKPYRGKWKKWYDPIKGHTGNDLDFFNEPLPSPVSGKVELIAMQPEMGHTLYLSDQENGNIHVFAHMGAIVVKKGESVTRNQILGNTDNSGKASSGPHLHYEIITFFKPKTLWDRVMTRQLQGFRGWNIDPLAYIRNLYDKYNLDAEGNKK